MVLVVELTLADGQVIGLEAGDQITISALGDDYSGCWFCLSKTSNSTYVRKFFVNAPGEAQVKIGKSVSFKCSDIVSFKDVDSNS